MPLIPNPDDKELPGARPIEERLTRHLPLRLVAFLATV